MVRRRTYKQECPFCNQASFRGQQVHGLNCQEQDMLRQPRQGLTLTDRL
jgi:hypothetical protein